MKRLIPVLLLFLGVVPCHANTYYVWTNSTQHGPGTNWTTAFRDIQSAVDVAVSGDVVRVTNGVYDTGTRVTPGYSLLNRIVVTNPISVESVNGPDHTIIVGVGPMGPTAVRGAYLSAGQLVGFRIVGGNTWTNGAWWMDQVGGGVWAAYSKISNCVMVSNAASACGGGFAYATADNCTSSDNWAWLGGGAYYSTANNCDISRNYSVDGGGIREVTARNCTISGNSSYWDGGGASWSSLTNCLLFGNWADNSGGGAYSSVLHNCTVAANTSTNGGGVTGGAINNSIVQDNAATFSNNLFGVTAFQSCCPELIDGVNGNISGDAMFVNAGASDFRLLQGSPCIDALTNLPNVIIDFAGIPRPLDGNDDGVAKWDMGAHEFVHPTADTDGDNSADSDELRADTDAINDASTLRLTDARQDNGARIYWNGGRSVTQYVERCTDLVTGPWQRVHTNTPPTATSTNWTDRNGTNFPTTYYRITVP